MFLDIWRDLKFSVTIVKKKKYTTIVVVLMDI